MNRLTFWISKWKGSPKKKYLRISVPSRNAWWYINNEWIFVPKGTPFHWGGEVTETHPPIQELEDARLNRR